MAEGAAPVTYTSVKAAGFFADRNAKHRRFMEVCFSSMLFIISLFVFFGVFKSIRITTTTTTTTKKKHKTKVYNRCLRMLMLSKTNSTVMRNKDFLLFM